MVRAQVSGPGCCRDFVAAGGQLAYQMAAVELLLELGCLGSLACNVVMRRSVSNPMRLFNVCDGTTTYQHREGR